jgi:hypothetical protein
MDAATAARAGLVRLLEWAETRHDPDMQAAAAVLRRLLADGVVIQQLAAREQ